MRKAGCEVRMDGEIDEMPTFHDGFGANDFLPVIASATGSGMREIAAAHQCPPRKLKPKRISIWGGETLAYDVSMAIRVWFWLGSVPEKGERA